MTESAILAGPPGSISGFVPFHNTSSSPQTITDVTVDDEGSSVSLVISVPETVVEPGQRVRLELRMEFPPQTPAAAYPLEITVADTTVPAVAHVAEEHNLGLSPEFIVVPNTPGATIVRSIVIANEGNVDVSVAGVDDLAVYAEDEARSTLARLATTTLLDGSTDIEPLPDRQSTLQVAPAGGTQAISPGATRAVELEITLPEDLPQGGRWLAGWPIALRTAVIAVIPGGSNVEEH